MYDINEVCDEIKQLEKYDLSQDVAKKLAILYTIKDYYKTYYEGKENKNAGTSSMMTGPTTMMSPMMEK